MFLGALIVLCVLVVLALGCQRTRRLMMLDDHQTSVAAMIVMGMTYAATRIAGDVTVSPLLTSIVGLVVAMTPLLLIFYAQRWTSPMKLAVEIGIIFSVVYTLLSIFDQVAH